MKKLILDTSNKFLFIAVYEDSTLIFRHIQEGNNNHSETLVSVLERLLKEHNIAFEREKTFLDCKFQDSLSYARFDFFVDNSYIIEVDG